MVNFQSSRVSKINFFLILSQRIWKGKKKIGNFLFQKLVLNEIEQIMKKHAVVSEIWSPRNQFYDLWSQERPTASVRLKWSIWIHLLRHKVFKNFQELSGNKLIKSSESGTFGYTQYLLFETYAIQRGSISDFRLSLS